MCCISEYNYFTMQNTQETEDQKITAIAPEDLGAENICLSCE